MRYLGGKARIASQLAAFLNSQLKTEQAFVDLFCGSCNIASKIDQNRLVICNDKHPYLIAMWKKLQQGWELPTHISEDEYQDIRNNLDRDPALSGFVGFACSFGGKWFGGYARDPKRNYTLNAHRGLYQRSRALQNAVFICEEYNNVVIPEDALVYCDVPYRGTTQYDSKLVGTFDHLIFYLAVRCHPNRHIYISEYAENVPDDFEVVLEIESKKDLGNAQNKKDTTREVLIKLKETKYGLV